MAKVAYISPHGGAYVAILDTPDPLLDHKVVLGELKRVDIADDHPAHTLTTINGVAHEEKSVRSFGGGLA